MLGLSNSSFCMFIRIVIEVSSTKSTMSGLRFKGIIQKTNKLQVLTPLG